MSNFEIGSIEHRLLCRIGAIATRSDVRTIRYNPLLNPGQYPTAVDVPDEVKRFASAITALDFSYRFEPPAAGISDIEDGGKIELPRLSNWDDPFWDEHSQQRPAILIDRNVDECHAVLVDRGQLSEARIHIDKGGVFEGQTYESLAAYLEDGMKMGWGLHWPSRESASETTCRRLEEDVPPRISFRVRCRGVVHATASEFKAMMMKNRTKKNARDLIKISGIKVKGVSKMDGGELVDAFREAASGDEITEAGWAALAQKYDYSLKTEGLTLDRGGVRELLCIGDDTPLSWVFLDADPHGWSEAGYSEDLVYRLLLDCPGSTLAERLGEDLETVQYLPYFVWRKGLKPFFYVSDAPPKPGLLRKLAGDAADGAGWNICLPQDELPSGCVQGASWDSVALGVYF